MNSQDWFQSSTQAEDRGGLHGQAHPRENRICLTALGWIPYCLTNSIPARPGEDVKWNTGPFTCIGLLNLPNTSTNQESVCLCYWWGNWNLGMLRLSQDHATGKWLHLKLTLSASMGEDKVCFKEKEELVGGSLTQTAHFSFLPGTTSYSSH